MTKKTVLKCAAVALAAALFIGGGTSLFGEDVRQKQVENEFERFRPTVFAAEISVENGETTPSKANDESPTTVLAPNETGTESTEITDDVPTDIPDCERLETQAAELQAVYPDALGWLTIPGTRIDYPLMQSDDNSFYLTHAPDGSSLKCGSVFLDFRCERRLRNNFNVIYAHNMKNGSMFADICRFKNADFFETHRYGWLTTPEAVYRVDFFSVAVTDWYDEIYTGYRPLEDWLPHICEISRIYEEIDLNENDRLVLFSTCSYEFKNARTVLIGRLTEMEGG